MFHQGQQIGLYTLVRKLADGGFGEVWLAEKQSEFITKKVAIKLPHDQQVDFEAVRQEATLWEQASGHPNVLPIIDADVYDGQVAIVSEYAEGGSLADRLSSVGKFPVREAVETTIGILNGLEYLHSKNIVHRDIKPANILLQGDTPRLADFGISRVVHTSTLTSVVVGTESYMSPESFEGVRSVQTDVWSVGVLLYKLLTGDLPFPPRQPMEAMYAILHKSPEPLPDEIPPLLKEIVYKALEKDLELGEDPPRRYQTAAAMRDDLKIFLETPPPSVVPGDQINVLPSPAVRAAEIKTRVRIPVSGVGSRNGFRRLLVNKPLLMLVGIAAVLGFALIISLAFYLFAKTDGAKSITQSNENSAAAASSNSTNRSAPVSNRKDSGPSALDYFNQGVKFYTRKSFDRSIEAFTKAIEINPDDYSFYNNRGLAFYGKRRYPEAIADFNKALELNPGDSAVYNNRGVAYEDGGDTERAIADYRQALEMNPKDEKARRNLNNLLK